MRHFSIIKNHPIVSGFIAVVLFVVVSFGLRIVTGKAQLLPIFGGQIMSVTYCPCSNNLALSIGAPTPGVYMYDGSSDIFMFYQLYRPGPWVLGLDTPGGACLVPAPDGCLPILFPTGTIRIAGTSM